MRNMLQSVAVAVGLVGVPSASHAQFIDVPANAPAAWGAAPGTIYLNRHGAFVQPAYMSNSSTNQSPLVPQPTYIPPFNWGDAAWGQFVSCVQAQFAPFHVTVTDIDPGADEHIEAIVGGGPHLIGQPPGVAGFAAGYCGVVDTRGVEFVFPDAMPFGHVQFLCEVAAQEIAHAYGLDHVTLCSDPMSYCPPSAPKTFQNVDATCGESYARPCRCGGYAQNSYRALMDAMGPADGMEDPPMPPTNPPPNPPTYPPYPPPPPSIDCNAGGTAAGLLMPLLMLLALPRKRRK